MNELNLIFGPKLPPQLETVGLAFIAAPTMQPDSAIGLLSAERYAKENYDHLQDDLGIFSEGVPDRDLNIQVTIPSVGGITNPSALGGFVNSGNVPLVTSEWSFPVINSAIRVAGIHISKAGTWSPIVQPGNVWRTYTLVSSGIEPATSWLRKAIPEDGKDHKVVLIYAIPEYRYGSTSSSSVRFPPTPAKFKTMKELGSPTGPHKITYAGDIDVLQEIKVNGTVEFSGTYTGVESETYVKDLNKTLKTIDVAKSTNPDDYVELTYLSYCDYYIYTGYRSASGDWFPFDANPEYGHIIGDDQQSTYRQSSDCLLEQVTLYSIPSAMMEYVYVETTSNTGMVLGTLQLKFYRAVDYGETHFVRHLVLGNDTEQISARDEGTVINTWGYATFGRNFYDELNVSANDVFSTRVPSMIPLGRLVLAAPASKNAVAVADIRERGGGVPIDFPMVAVETQTDGLDKLRSFLDMGIWEGKAIKEGGVIEIEIDISLLKTDPEDTDPNTFLASEIYEIVKTHIPPGIDFEIRYVSM